jgi:FkbM family methyltransferase
MNLAGTSRKATNRFRELSRRRSFRPYTIEKTVGDVKFPFYIGDSNGEAWYGGDQDDAWPELSFLRSEVVSDNDVVLECGGHHGASAILLSQLLGPEGHIVSFEPNSSNLNVLCRNLVLNHVANVTVEHAAVGSEAGSTKIFKKSNASVLPSRFLSSGMMNLMYGVEDVPVVTLDSYVHDHGLKPTFLKIDVEGYEGEVLKGAKKILETAPKLALELHTEVLDRYDTSVAEILSLLDLDRYETWIQVDDRNAPQPYDPKVPITHRVHLFAIPR